MKQSTVLFATLAAVATLGTLSAQSPSRTSRDGVFTEAQQKRGEAIYARECSTCHGERLKGGEGSPPLTGTEFNDNWNNKTVAELFDKIRQTMPAPPEQPGKLTPQETADVVAHILSVDGFPAGAAQLPGDADQLKKIRIVAEKP
jgi:mono/diheme cytochrome c family protein